VTQSRTIFRGRRASVLAQRRAWSPVLSPSTRQVMLIVARLTFALVGIVLFIVALPQATAGLSQREDVRPSPVLFVAPQGNDQTTCSRKAPCSSFARAYTLAKSGDIVSLAGGTYGPQSIPAIPTKSLRKNVVFRQATARRVVIEGGLKVFGDHITFENLWVSDFAAQDGSSNITFLRVKARTFYIGGASDIRIIRGNVGPLENGSPKILPNGAVTPTRILIDGVAFHDITQTDGHTHVECLLVTSVEGLIIRNSRFWNCEFQSVLIKHFAPRGALPPSNILIENNWFGATTRSGFYSLAFGAAEGEGFRNVTVRYNSLLQDISVSGAFFSDFRVVANLGLMHQWNCTPGVMFDHNVWSAARCSATDRRGLPAFVSPDHLNLRVSQRSPAVNAGTLANFPKADIFGHKRPRGRRPDAGAVETR
jgi:hypothetical protein